MAVFGVPVLHEDDALRALRAAVEMREAAAARGARNRDAVVRIGVSTGEVVTGTEERLATGDAVNVAARLEQAAPPGEILIGRETYRLVRDAAEVGAARAARAEGKGRAGRGLSFAAVHGEAGLRRHGLGLDGRARAAAAHLAAFGSVRLREQRASCSRSSARPALASPASSPSSWRHSRTPGRARPLPPYGEGITYWPVVGWSQCRRPMRPRRRPATRSPQRSMGSSGTGSWSPREEIAWAFRKHLERCHGRPLICVFDDLHWGEETFLTWSSMSRTLPRCADPAALHGAAGSARPPNRLGRRQGQRPRCCSSLLRPGERALDRELADGRDSDAPVAYGSGDRGRNPLFVEEMLRCSTNPARGDVIVPPTIQALLAARLDQLDPRNAPCCSAARSRAVSSTAERYRHVPEEPELTARLTTLVRKELIRPDRTGLPRRGCLSFPAPAEPRRCVRRAAKSGGRSCTSVSRTGSRSTEPTFRSWTRCRLSPGARVRLSARARAHRARRRGAGRGCCNGISRQAGRRAMDRGDTGAAVNLLDAAKSCARRNR